MLVNTEDDVYPDINGAKAVDDKMSFHAYRDLDIKLNYSGTIIIGREFKKEFIGRTFTGPHPYAKTYELVFEEGILLDSKDTSGTYFGF